MKKYKEYIQTYLVISVYVVVSGYLIYLKNTNNFVGADAQLFCVLTIAFYALGFISFCNTRMYVKLAGLILMTTTMIMTALYLFL